MNKPQIFNLVNNKYVTNSTVWSVDETFFGPNIVAFLIVAFKSNAIIGYIINSKAVSEEIILELYQETIAHLDNKPKIIHSDKAKAYQAKIIQTFLQEQNVQLSNACGQSFGNQVSESVNNVLKGLVVQKAQLEPGFEKFEASLPNKLKKIKLKFKSKEYREALFSSPFFREKSQQLITAAIQQYNDNSHKDINLSKQKLEYLYNKIQEPLETQIVESNHPLAPIIKDFNKQEIQQANFQITQLLQQTDLDLDGKLDQIQSLVVENKEHELTRSVIKVGFRHVFQQNQKLQEQNDRLYAKLLQTQQDFDEVSQEIMLLKKERQEKLAKKEKRKNQTKKTPSQPMTSDIFKIIMGTLPANSYAQARLRVAMILLIIIGVRISELLTVQLKDIHTLTAEGWIAISRKKRGPANHKAFLSKKGKDVIAVYKRDLSLVIQAKNPDDFLFSPEKNHSKPLSREHFNRSVNLPLHKITDSITGKPYMTSYSFRKGYITQLWKDTGDIEFVRQVIGHASIQTTQTYIELLPEAERQKRILQIGSQSLTLDNLAKNVQPDILADTPE